MDQTVLLKSLEADVATILEVLRQAPGAAVPPCPGWSVADLARHHGIVQRWATRIVATGEGASMEDDVPDDGPALADWYAEAAGRLSQALIAADPDRPCWTFVQPPGTVRFWIRRQALEAAVHRWDAESAIGPPAGLAAGLAGAGIDEVVDDLFPRQVAMGRSPGVPGRLTLDAVDLGRCWHLQGDEAGSGGPEIRVRGTGSDLLLMLWGRIRRQGPAVAFEGGPEAVAQLEEVRFTP